MPEYLTVTEAAALLGMNRRTVQQWVRTGRIDGHQTPGGHWRIDREALDRADLNVGEFARRVGVHRATVRRWAEAGRIQCRRSAGARGDWLIPASEVARIGARPRRRPASDPKPADQVALHIGRGKKATGLTKRTNG